MYIFKINMTLQFFPTSLSLIACYDFFDIRNVLDSPYLLRNKIKRVINVHYDSGRKNPNFHTLPLYLIGLPYFI